uniref:Uncharacterized protein n=1 Tax=Arundo donax TaxID=35708 RepID=A0A0A8Z0T0_ARUDO
MSLHAYMDKHTHINVCHSIFTSLHVNSLSHTHTHIQ